MSTFELDPRVIEFRDQATKASYHHADDTCKEWGLAKPYERRCQEIYDSVSGDLKDFLDKIKGGYLITIRTAAKAREA